MKEEEWEDGEPGRNSSSSSCSEWKLPTFNVQRSMIKRVGMKATIQANGKGTEVTLPCTVAEFLAGRGLKATQVVVEYNGEALLRERFGLVQLKDGDRLEVVLPV